MLSVESKGLFRVLMANPVVVDVVPRIPQTPKFVMEDLLNGR